MAKPGYYEGLDDALLLISDDKLQDSVAAMVAQHTACLKKYGEQCDCKWVRFVRRGKNDLSVDSPAEPG
jgi:hypothetical protein